MEVEKSFFWREALEGSEDDKYDEDERLKSLMGLKWAERNKYEGEDLAAKGVGREAAQHFEKADNGFMRAEGAAEDIGGDRERPEGGRERGDDKV